MEEETKEFDSTLGGKYSLPKELNVLRFTAARCSEIEEIRQSLKSTKGVKLAFQKLPKHMRRRVMSHNAKRLPSRLREIHTNQLMKSGMPPKQKRPSRKYRRRPKNIVEHFAKRRNRCAWLETHIWHAKRFHIVEKWNYRLPERPCDKSFRACYRATSKHCLLQDISYYNCIQLTGRKTYIIENVKSICKQGEGLSVGAKIFVSGKREGSVTFYDENEAIGEVLFNWKPNLSNADGNDVLWIWVHAAFYKQVLTRIINLFSLEMTETRSHYINEQHKTHLRELKDELNRFRLTGPLAQSILSKSLIPIDLNKHATEWLKDYLENDDLRQIFSEQLDYWAYLKGLNSPAIVSPRVITSLIVVDPRYNFPKRRSKATPENKGAIAVDQPISPNLSMGAIWEENIRQRVKEEKVSNAVLNQMRSQLLVPGSELDVPGAPIPIMLVHRPGKQNSGFCSGWDVIIPSGWAQPFWMCFIMWGARAGGLRESESVDFEMGRTNFLRPDTKAGKLENDDLHTKSTNKYFRLPPNKRTNFNRFSTVSPFKFNWELLVDEWQENSSLSFSVLRDIGLLDKLKDALVKKTPINKLERHDLLVPIKLTLKSGLLRTFSLICMPNIRDLKNPPIEEQTCDINKEKRKQLREKHKVLLKRFSKKRKIAKRSGNEINLDMEVLKDYQPKMRELWLPSDVKSIRHSCSREVMGFVTKGGFSYASGKSSAVGYVAISAIKKLLEANVGNKVLVRNNNTRQYRVATMEIIV